MPKKLLIIAAIATFILIIIMGITGVPLTTEATPQGILDAEFANTTDKAKLVYDTWNKANVLHDAKVNTCWDFLFLICYGSLFYLACTAIANRFRLTSWEKWGKLLAKLAIVIGLCDVVENVLMFSIFNNTYTETKLGIMFTFSVIKWFLVTVTIFFIFIGVLKLFLNSKFFKR